MKIWIRSCLSVALAVFIGAFIPVEWAQKTQAFALLSDLCLRLGQWIVFPLLFFSFTVRLYDLIRDKKWRKTARISVLYIVLSSLLFSLTGALAALALKGIHINPVREAPFPLPTAADFLADLLPANFFRIFSSAGTFLLPLLLFAAVMAAALRAGKEATRPLSELFDSLASLFHLINRWVAQFSFIGFFFITLNALLVFKQSHFAPQFLGLLVLYLLFTLTLLIIVYPMLLYGVAKVKNPYKILFASLTPLLGAFFSGSLFFATPLTLIHNERNLKMTPAVNTVSTAVGLLFGRAGSAFVVSSAAVLLMKSITGIAYLGVGRTLLIILLSFAVAFFTGAFHPQGVLASVALISVLLKTHNAEYLSLIGIAPLLYCFAALIDTLNNTVMTFLVHDKTEGTAEIKASRFL